MIRRPLSLEAFSSKLWNRNYPGAHGTNEYCGSVKIKPQRMSAKISLSKLMFQVIYVTYSWYYVVHN